MVPYLPTKKNEFPNKQLKVKICERTIQYFDSNLRNDRNIVVLSSEVHLCREVDQLVWHNLPMSQMVFTCLSYIFFTRCIVSQKGSQGGGRGRG